MSDCVRFGTVNDTVTPANSSGENGFPFPMANGPTGTGTGTSNPVKIPYQQAIGWWHRVKNWSVTSTTTLHSGGDVGFLFGTMDNSGNATRERDLVIPALPRHLFSLIGSVSQDIGFNINPAFILDADFLHVWPALDSYYSGTFLTTLANGGSTITFAFDTTKLPGAPTGSLTLTLDGVPIDLYYNAVLAGTDTFTPGAITITATEFWQYASFAAGTPVYNTSTGTQLQAPTN